MSAIIDYNGFNCYKAIVLVLTTTNGLWWFLLVQYVLGFIGGMLSGGLEYYYIILE